MTTYTLEQLVRYDYPAPIDNLRQRLMVVPPLRHGRQQRRSWSLRVDGALSSHTRTRVDRFGNHAITVNAKRVSTWVEFSLETEVVVDDGPARLATAYDARFLRSTPLTTPDARIVALVREVPPEPGAMCAAVHDAFTYEHDVTAVSTTAAEALGAGRGVCQDYAHVMVSACRHAGIPARYVSGHLLGEGGSHAWVEVLSHVRGRHWVAEGWDPTHNRRTDAGYLTVAVGRDYADVAPLSGTYEGATVGTLTVTKRVSRSEARRELAGYSS